MKHAEEQRENIRCVRNLSRPAPVPGVASDRI
jgi:hypothetical protein